MSLFVSNAWQQAWWATWGRTAGFHLVGNGEGDKSGLYLDSYRLWKILPIRCLQFVGTNYRRLSTPRTEYNTLFSRSVVDEIDLRTVVLMLESQPWGEAVFRDIRIDSPDLQAIGQLAVEKGWLVREIAKDQAYSVDTSGSFDHYLKALGKNTRLKLFNRRTLLASNGSVELSNAWPNRVDVFFDLLNTFHRQRWGGPCFNSQSLRFHKAFLEQVCMEGGRPDLSLLCYNGQVISVTYNVWYKGRVYNLQSGYIEDFHRKIALGTLHLGYCIESAFEDAETREFDMLAGTGKNDNYKSRLATNSVELRSIMVVRNSLLKALYRLKDRREAV